MNDWQTCALPDSFVKNKISRRNQIPAKDIAEVGRFPVVDQGQKFVAGYCDDESRVIDFELPLIIFGDHTRCLKYVDFPFVLGADGTKVLLPNRNLYDPKFYYFALLALRSPVVATIATSLFSTNAASLSPTPRAEEDRAHPFDGTAGDRSAGGDHSDHHRAEKGSYAQALQRRAAWGASKED